VFVNLASDTIFDARLVAMGFRAICVSRDTDVHRVVGDALAEAGISVEHHASLPGEPADLALVVVDRTVRQTAGDALRALTAPVVVVGDDLADDALMSLMLDAPVSHLVADPTDRDLGITSHKLATGDLFGLEKYLAPGTAVAERAILTTADKRHAMDAVWAWAEAIGARRPTVHRIANVVDELLMNAMLDAPRQSRPSLLAAAPLLRWGADAGQLAISVGDGHGALRQRDVIDHVLRARGERGRPQPADDESGAGLGLYLVLANVASLIVNVEPGRRTEVVCLFDLGRGPRRAVARSLHVFQAQPAT
jgi:hypothetical protein